MNCLRGSFAPYWQSIQRALFPQLEPVLGPLTGKQQQLVQTLEVIRIEQWIPRCFRVPGRPRKDRAALARAFVAKAVYDMPTTRVLLDRLVTDVALRRICGWERKSEVPSESVFSRAFVEFSDTQLPQRTHAALIRNTHHDRLVGHLCRDSTAIEAREKPAAKEKTPPLPKRKPGRPNKGEERPKVLKRLDRQAAMTLPAMLDDLPTDCDVGMKKDSKGYKSTWVGYKLHLDVADGQIPISCLLTSASLHDSQAAIPLATLSAERTTNLYDLMDAAYDAEPIRQHSRSLGHVPLIDTNPRRDKALAEELRTEQPVAKVADPAWPRRDRARTLNGHGNGQETGGAPGVADVGGHGGPSDERRASLLRAAEPGPGGFRIRCVRRGVVRGFLRGQAGPSESASGSVFPDAVHRLFRGSVVGAGDCVAGGRFAESAVVPGPGVDRGGAGSLDAVAHAAADRRRDP